MRIPRPLFIGAASLLSLASSAAAAQASAVTDVRCLLLSTLFESNLKEAKGKEIAAKARLYYAGRVSTLSHSEIQAARRSIPREFKGGAAGQMMNRCFQTMQSNGQSLEALLKRPAD